MLSRHDAAELAYKLSMRYLTKPKSTEKIAKDFGLWETLKASLSHLLELAHARIDANAFIEYAFRTDNGEPMKQAAFHRDWQALLGKPDTNVLIMAPRSHGKSIQIMGRLVWEIGKRPMIRIKIVCAIVDAAQTILSLVEQNIQSNSKVREVFPNLILDTELSQTRGSITVVREKGIHRDPTVQAYGVLGTAAGGRADLLVCDDVVDYANAVTNPALRPKVIEALQTIWLPLKSSTGKMWWLCTPYHVADATHVFREKGGVFDEEWRKPVISYEIQYDEDGEVLRDKHGEPVTKIAYLWPEAWNAKAVEKRRNELGPRAFAQQMMLRVQSDEDLTFPIDDLRPSFDSMLWRIGQYLPVEGEAGLIPDSWPCFAGIDLASALGQKAAYCVIFVIARNPDNKRLYLKDMIRKKLKFPQLIREIELAYDKHRWQHGYVENNAFQSSVDDELSENYKHIPIKGVHTGINKSDPKIGLPAMGAAFNRGLFCLPARDVLTLTEADTSPFGIFWDELSNHPGAKHSDTVMALWLAYRCYVSLGISTIDAWHAGVASSA